MAKDDYNYIVHNILTYLYSCFQRKNSFTKEQLYIAASVIAGVGDKSISNGYFLNVLRYMQDDGLVSGLDFVNPWGNEYILWDENIENIAITSTGIRYLLDDSKMKEIRETISNSTGIIRGLVKMVFDNP